MTSSNSSPWIAGSQAEVRARQEAVLTAITALWEGSTSPMDLAERIGIVLAFCSSEEAGAIRDGAGAAFLNYAVGYACAKCITCGNLATAEAARAILDAIKRPEAPNA